MNEIDKMDKMNEIDEVNYMNEINVKKENKESLFRPDRKGYYGEFGGAFIPVSRIFIFLSVRTCNMASRLL